MSWRRWHWAIGVLAGRPAGTPPDNRSPRSVVVVGGGPQSGPCDAHLGYRVAAIARGTGKAGLAEQLGADEYIDSEAGDPGAALMKLGGAAAVIATAASGSSMSPLVTGLAPRGGLVVVGAAPDPLSVNTPNLIFGERRILGSLTGSSIENEDSVEFAVRHGIRPMVETIPLGQAPDGYARMMSGQARFRVVLDVEAGADRA